MKKIFFTLLCLTIGLFQLSAQSHRIINDTDNQIVFTVTTGNLTTESISTETGTFTRLMLDGCAASVDNVGKPELPIIIKSIEIPVCGDIHVTATAGRVRTLSAEEAGISHTVYPTQPLYHKSYMGERTFVKDEATYRTNDNYGMPLATVAKAGIARDVCMADVRICPIQVNPVTNTVTIYDDITITVTYDNVDMAATRELKLKYGSREFGRPAQIINTIESAQLRDAISTRPVKMLIIANSMFEGQLDALANWKRRKGFIVEIAYTGTIGTTTTAITNYIAGQFTNATASNPAPTYVLLVGDQAQIPTYSTQANLDSHVTDLYYFTQVGSDYVPDCYWGRFSAQNVSQLTPQIDKTMKYEQLSMGNDLTYLDRCLLVAGNDRGTSGDHGYSHGNPTLHYFEDNYASTFFTTTDSYYNPHASSDDATIRTKLSNGTGFANYTAHCSSAGWADPAFQTNNISSLSNTGKYGFMVGNCCQSNKFEESECFGEAIMRASNKGAVGYIGGTDYTYWDHDYYWAVGARSGNLSSNCTNCNSATYQANNLGAYDRMCHTHGEAFSNWNVTQGSINYAGNMAVQSKYGTNDNYVRYYWEIYELMGDPSVMPWLGQPADMTIRVDNIAPIANTIELIDGTTTIAVSTGAPFSYVALTQNLNLIAATLTDANGNCTLTFPALNAGETYELAASAQNYKTTFTTINVMAGEGARVVITDVTVTNNAQAVASAHLTLDVTIENRFPDAATNTSISATTTSGQITLTDATETVGTVNSGESRTLTASFALNVSNAISDGDIATIEFTVNFLSNETAESTTYTYDLALVDALLDYVSDNYTIVGGNNDDIINPGETVTITIVDENIGHATAQNIVSELSTYYNLTPITNGTVNIGTVTPQSQCTSTFTVNIGDNVPNGTMVPFFHHIYSTTNAALTRVDTVWLLVGEVTATETWETGDMSQFEWRPSETYPWTVVNSGAYAGTYCARSGNYNVNSSTSELQLTINAPIAGEVSYYSRVSSENNYDFFYFYLDGVQMERRSGNGNWVYSSWPIEAGTHTLKFTYEKDYSQHGNSDYAWVDNISFPGNGEIAPEPEALNDISQNVIITTGNGDADINPGETIDLTITTENLSEEAFTNVSSVLSTTSPYVTIANANETITVIPAQGTATTTYHITIDPATPDSTIISFSHVASTSVHTAPTYMASITVFEVASPRLEKISDSYTVSGGNNDNTIDPGETVVLTIVDENSGRADAPDVISHLSTYYTPAAVTNGTITVGAIEAGEQYASNFTINISDDIPVGTIIPYVHHIFSTTDPRADRIDTIYLTVGSTEATEDWESGTFTQFEWVNNSQYPWTIVNAPNEAVGGNYYAKSGNAGRNNSQSNLELTINTTDGEVSFFAKVASEPDYDFFKFYIDGVEQLSVSGGVVQTGGGGYNQTYSDTCTWQRYAYPITSGTHTIKFSFTKDAYVGAGSDCAKVDNITWPTNAGGGIAPMPEGIVITDAGLNANSNGYELETANFDVTLENSSAEAIENVTLTMTTTSSALTLTDNTETVASIGSAETLNLAGIFAGDIAAVADGHVVNCTVTADYLLENVPTQRTYNFNFTVHSAILLDMTHSEVITEGNDDEEINPGETIEITITTDNIGVAAISGVTSELMTTSSYATIVNATQTIDNIAANGTATTVYTVNIAPSTPDNTTIVFTHTASDEVHGSTTLSFSINVLEVAVARLVDVNHNETIIAGNDDNDINPGEIVRINVNTRNDGRAAASNAVSELTTESPYATINNGSQIIGTIAPNASVNSQFDIEIAADVLDQTVIDLIHTMYSDDDTCTMTISLTVTVYTGTSDLVDESYSISIVSGNGDNDINPGEGIKVTVYSRNNGDGNAENVVSTLMTSSAYATIDEPVVNFTGAAPNASLTSQYNVSIDPNASNNTTISFTHTITDGTTSDNLSFDIIVINNDEGISENGLSTITLYPNPTSDNVTVSLSEGIEATHIRLFNTFGQLISSMNVTDSATVINMSQLPNGVYFVQIFNNHELISTSKVVKK